MATGVGTSFDISKLGKELDRLDKQLDAIVKKGEKAQQAIEQMLLGNNATNFLNKIEKIKKNVIDLSSIKDPMKWDSAKLKGYIDQVNRLLRTVNQINEVNGGKNQLVDTAQLEKAKKEFKSLLTEVKSLEKAQGERSTSRNQTYSGALRYSANVKNLEQERQAVINLEAARDKLKKSDADYATKLNTLNLAIQKHEQNLRNATKTDQQRAEEARKASEKIVEAQRKERAEYERRKTSTMDKYYSSNSSRALKFSTNAKTLEEEARAVKYLEAARAKLNTQDANYKRNLATLNAEIKRHKHNLDEAKKGAQDLQEKHRGLMDTSGQLARAMAAVFSVSAIRGYVNKLVAIRGEFEMQQRSLQVLLQNKDEANALWDKTVALAVKSPFTTKQLVTYTKQLAAYRIESEKLYETNKMLADVSAGLGVDMNRLILAFGQVKAANFLRGTELRQFSEAGVNMLDELANRFTTLEGRAVSVGEVFERVSKRMVTFADVEAVFQKITSKGGTFFQMQEKQSKTLKGMTLNLRDSYELMLNEIGEEHDGILKGMISLMRELVNNWRELAPYIETAGLTFAAYFSAKQLANLVTWFGKLATAIRGMGAASAAASAINPWVALATVIAAVGVAFYETLTYVSEFEAISIKTNKEITEIFTEQLSLYEELADKINDSTKSEKEREETLKELKDKYGEILPDMYTELEYIKAHAGNYQAAEDAMRSYYNSLAKERKKSKVLAMHEESLYGTDIPELAKGLRQSLKRYEKYLGLTPLEREKLGANIEAIIGETVEAYLGSETSNFQDTLAEKINKYIGKEVAKGGSSLYSPKFLLKFQSDYATEQLYDIIDELEETRRELKSVQGLAFGTLKDELNAEEVELIKKEVNKVEEAYKALSGIYGEIAKGDTTAKEAESKIEKQKEILTKALGEDFVNELNANLSNISKSSLDYTVGLSKVTKDFYQALSDVNMLSSFGSNAVDNQLVDVLSQTISNKGKELTEFQKIVANVFNIVSDTYKLTDKDTDIFANLFPDNTKTRTDVITNISGKIEQLTSDVEAYNKAVKAGNPDANILMRMDKDVLAQYLNQIEALKLAREMLGGDDKKTKKSGKDTVEERIKVIKEVYKAYKELNKTFDETTSKTGAMEKFGDAFYSAFGKTPEQMGYNLFTAEGVVAAYDKLIASLSDKNDIIKANLAKGEFVMELQVEMKQEKDKAVADQIKQMFDGYELSLELDKLNIPKDLASRLFGIEDIDLSDIRKRIEQEIYNAQLKGGQEDFIAKRKEELEKVKDMEIKQQRELLKTYSKYLVQAQSERIKIKLDELRQLKEIESLEIGDADKELMRQGVQKDIQKRLDTQAWKDFQESGMYVRLFDNLEGASMHSLDKMENSLMGLRDSLKDLDPSKLKEINNQLEKIRDIKVDKNPFRSLANDAKTYFEYVKNRKDWEASLDASEEKEANIRNEADSQSLYIKSLEDELDLIDKTTDEGYAYALVLESHVELEKEYLKVLLDELEAQRKITKEERERIEKGQDAGKSMQNRLSKTAQDISAVTSSMADMATNLEAAFGMSDSMKDTFEAIQGVGSGISEMTAGIAGLASQDPVQMFQGAMQLVSGVSKIFASFNEAHDKRIERKIESEIKLVERLGKLYEKLGKQIEQAYSINTLKYANDAANKNLEQQYKSYEDMIAAEEDKKKTDHERIEEWRKVQEEILEKQEELERDRLQSLGGVGGETNYKDAAQSFVDAWLEAFKETGNGIEALDEEFNSMLENIVKRQLLLRATDSFLTPIFNEIDKAVKDTEVTTKEMNDIKELAGKTLPELDKFLEELANDMGLSDLAGSTSELSGLSAGIQGMSAEQADILAAYWSSSRFLLSTIDNNVRTITENLGINAEVENPMLPHLRTIAEQTAAINSLLNSLTAPHPTQSGKGLKVII